MTEHLPECYERFTLPRTCVVCDALRECEKRVTAYERSWENAVIIARAGYDDGYDAALDSALEAVENLPDVIFQQAAWVKHDMAMDAVNALRKGER